jgi:hypothetical protein
MDKNRCKTYNNETIEQVKVEVKPARKQLQQAKKTRNVKPYKDKWAQIKYAYISKNIPMPESYYEKQVNWFANNTPDDVLMKEQYIH